MPKFSFPQLTGEGTATEGFVHVHFSNTCDSSDKDLMIVTDVSNVRLTKWSQASQVFLINLVSLMHFSAPCLIGVKFGGLNPLSFIRLTAYPPLTRVRVHIRIRLSERTH